MQFLWLIILLGRLLQQQPTDMCIAAYSDTHKYIIHVPSGKVTSTPLILDKNLSKFVLPNAISPDGQRVAKVVLTEEDTNGFSTYRPVLPVQLSVKKLRNPFVRAQIVKITQAFIPADIELSWSPDSQWLAYLWHTPAHEYYIALADANGKTIKEEKLPITSPQAFLFDHWSPDSRFISLIRRGVENYNFTYDISFWSAPDLHNVTPKYKGHISVDSCETSNADDFVYCVKWANTGHQPAIVTDNQGSVSLLLPSLDPASIQSFSIPELPGNPEIAHRIFIAWANNNQYISVTRGAYKEIEPNKNYQNGSNSLYVSALHIFGIDGTSQMNVDENAVMTLHNAECCDQIQWKWSTDKSILYYVRYDSTKKSIFEVVAYNADTKQKQVLLTFSSVNIFVDFYPSPDNKSVGVFVYGEPGVILYWVDSKGQSIQTMNFDAVSSGVSLVWSSTTPSYLAVIESMPEETLSEVAGKFSIKIYQSDGTKIMKRVFNFAAYSDWQQPEWAACP